MLAMREALADAGLAAGDADWVNLHGTGTRANDAMEDVPVRTVFGTAVPCSSTKGWTGHTLGACGILEALLIAGRAWRRGWCRAAWAWRRRTRRSGRGW